MKEPGSHKLVQVGTSTVALNAQRDPALKARQVAENSSKWPSSVPARPPTQDNFEHGQGLWPFKNPSVFQSLTLTDAAIDTKSQSDVQVFPYPVNRRQRASLFVSASQWTCFIGVQELTVDWNEFTDLLRNLASQFLSQSSLKIKLDKCKQTVSKEMLGINSGHFRVRLPALEILISMSSVWRKMQSGRHRLLRS